MDLASAARGRVCESNGSPAEARPHFTKFLLLGSVGGFIDWPSLFPAGSKCLPALPVRQAGAHTGAPDSRSARQMGQWAHHSSVIRIRLVRPEGLWCMLYPIVNCPVAEFGVP